MPETDCKKCQQVRKEVVPEVGGILFEDDLWIVVHKGAPIGVAGHLQLVSKRHYQGPAHMTDAEASHLGLMLRHCEAILAQVSGASAVYTAALGASTPHFHCHMVPKHEGGPSAWAVFDQERLASEGSVVVDIDKCAFIAEAFKAAMVATPPPPCPAVTNRAGTDGELYT
mmetsp:Transcript_35041/g.85894  ORF Transcript_35041/g.85894 Transcript_35041/m.85894 type:complete len:170 (+) Transcript_35041:95-604(+)|eukprot:CAMPEP_0197592264 /NCGR_PEP_ID=MMETSP1326-20131121/14997_1 /TAXON_ID=1155430 /ORGANISM="Genus nov. species nov., Strain RCC2288" /LENGTH=169 /DNA_ID=CAMNT_0043157947 /DNA_START=67 /DNA_END=576 /DNA_ORIENTATION=-